MFTRARTKIQIQTSINTLGYYVTLPVHLSNLFGYYFENLTRQEQRTMLLVLVAAMESETADPKESIQDAYELCDGELPDNILDGLEEIGIIESTISGTIEALAEALLANIRYTTVISQ